MLNVGQLLALISLISFVYFALSPSVATILYRPMIFHPLKFPVGNYQLKEVDGIKYNDIIFHSSDGTRLNGWYFSYPQSKRVILLHHGNAGNISTRLGLLQLLLKTKTSVFVYDYRGYGKSGGLPDPEGVCNDGNAAFDYLVNEEKIAPENIINYGESLGGAVACEVSKLRPGCGLILQSAFCSLKRIGDEKFPPTKIYPEWLYPKPYLDNLILVQQKHPPLLIIHGEKDKVVPFAQGKDLFASAIDPKWFLSLSNSGHSDMIVENPDQYIAGLNKYFSDLNVKLLH